MCLDSEADGALDSEADGALDSEADGALGACSCFQKASWHCCNPVDPVNVPREVKVDERRSDGHIQPGYSSHVLDKGG